MTKIKAILLLIAFTINCTSCTRTPKIPPASINFIGFINYGDARSYVHLTSDENLIKIFEIYESQNQNNPTLLCSLDHDENFDVNHKIKSQGRGPLQPDMTTNEAGKFYFRALMSFYTVDKRDNTTEIPVTSAEILNALLEGQKEIPCKVYITAYGYKAYYTNVVLLPAKGLVEYLRERNTHELAY